MNPLLSEIEKEEIGDAILCEHEAAHVIAHWIATGQPLAVAITDEGGAAGTEGQDCDLANGVSVLLAGHAYTYAAGRYSGPFAKPAGEFLRLIADIEELDYSDITMATALIAEADPLRLHGESVQDALARHFDLTCGILLPYSALIDDLAGHLRRRRDLSAQDVADVILKHAAAGPMVKRDTLTRLVDP
jgi:hypothetical protein